MEIELTLKLDIEYQAYPEEPRTRHYPGAGAEAEIIKISILGIPVDELLFDAIIDEYGEEITEACLDDAIDNEAEDAVAYAEHMRDVMEDR